jgi:ribosome maturation factor RimP
MRENSRRGAPRPARATDRTSAGRDPRSGGSGGRGSDQAQRGPAAGSRGPGSGDHGPGSGDCGVAAAAADVARLTKLVEPVLRALDMDLETLKISSAGRRRVLRIIVDADGGVSLDDIAEVSREVSARLDAGNAMGEAPYTLEVSSPGVDRPLTQPRHWRRAAGRLVAVPLAAENHDSKRDAPASPALLEGRVIGADLNGVTLEMDGSARTFGYAELGPGRVQLEFGRLDEADAADDVEEEEPGGY